MGIADIAETEIAFHHLHQIEPLPFAHPVEQIIDRRQQMKCNKEQRQRPHGGRNTHPFNAIRIRIFELYRENRKLVLGCERS